MRPDFLRLQIHSHRHPLQKIRARIRGWLFRAARALVRAGFLGGLNMGEIRSAINIFIISGRVNLSGNELQTKDEEDYPDR